MPHQSDSLRFLSSVTRYTMSKSNVGEAYFNWITTQKERDSDLIIRYFSKDENGYLEEQHILCNRLILQGNPTFSRILSVQAIRENRIEMTSESDTPIIHPKTYLDIQAHTGFEDIPFNILLACVQFLYSNAFESKLVTTEKDALDLYDYANKFKLKLLCELLCNCPTSTSFEMSAEEQEFLNTREDFEMYNSGEDNKLGDIGIVRIVAPDLYSKIKVERARYINSINAAQVESPEEPPHDEMILNTEDLSNEEVMDDEFLNNLDEYGNHSDWIHDKKIQIPEDEQIEWKCIFAHKGILTNRSDFFSSMFEMNFVENRNNEIRINDTSIQTIEAIIYWMYTGKFPNVQSENAIELFVASCQFNLAPLKDWSRLFIQKYIDFDNVVTILEMAEVLGDVDLKSCCVCFMANRFDIISKDPNFTQLPFNLQLDVKALNNKIKIKSRKKKSPQPPSKPLR
ncbi:hypothetical protein C9374_004302 [Naegleria lovaniensis]|uniref:BTB domain-containing protein n=1 Tax=Naegleria lovaniensis TaxID=51637 RepID=A0AA88KPD8_NAELO|nr:uncharacterized protein C9374_004302 [Naegleria lovaniensis]KAG2383631.1 hypothetical protein C9374_004302 [Naegleria lovaniensis]